MCYEDRKMTPKNWVKHPMNWGESMTNFFSKFDEIGVEIPKEIGQNPKIVD